MAALALAGFKAAPPSKSPVGPIAFEDFEALEAGQSHEFVSPALLTPSPVPTPRRPNWVPCRVSRPRKDRFALRAEAGAFLDSGIAKSGHGLLVLTTYRSCKQLIAMLDAIDDDSFREFEALCARTLLSES